MRDKLLERKYQKYQKFYLHMIFSFFLPISCSCARQDEQNSNIAMLLI